MLINNWEATYFDFDADKLVDFAKAAAPLGVELLVMDDGWFGDIAVVDLPLAVGGQGGGPHVGQAAVHVPLHIGDVG